MKKAIKYSILGLAALCTVLLCGGYYMLGYSLKPDDLVSRSRNIAASYDFMYERYPELHPWVDSLMTAGALKDFYIENDRGETLHALYVAAAHPTLKTAVIVHGYTDNAVRMLMIGYLYSKEMGFNILLPDLYGHGMSEGNHVQMGWKDRLDVMHWMGVAERMFRKDGYESRMVVHGVSMGAATTMNIAGERTPGYVKCFVEDCGYTSAWDEFAHEMKKRFDLHEFPLLYVSSMLCKLKYGWSFGEASPVRQLKNSHKPMLFIHGGKDDFVPTEMVYPCYEAKPQPKSLWIAPGSAHAVSYRDHKKEYTGRVKAFVEKWNR